MKHPYPDANTRSEYLSQYDDNPTERAVALKAMNWTLEKADAFMKEKYGSLSQEQIEDIDGKIATASMRDSRQKEDEEIPASTIALVAIFLVLFLALAYSWVSHAKDFSRGYYYGMLETASSEVEKREILKEKDFIITYSDDSVEDAERRKEFVKGILSVAKATVEYEKAREKDEEQRRVAELVKEELKEQKCLSQMPLNYREWFEYVQSVANTATCVKHRGNADVWPPKEISEKWKEK